MKYLCLAYGAEKDWLALSKSEQDALLAQDEVLRERGALMAAVQTHVTSVRAWDGTPTTSDGALASCSAPLAGFSIIEAANVDEVVRLVSKTPCAVFLKSSGACRRATQISSRINGSSSALGSTLVT
jgi:hypothetical protein